MDEDTKKALVTQKQSVAEGPMPGDDMQRPWTVTLHVHALQAPQSPSRTLMNVGLAPPIYEKIFADEYFTNMGSFAIITAED
jgi:hypothetical protein